MALLALGNLVRVWTLETSWLIGLLATGVACLLAGTLWQRVIKRRHEASPRV